MSLQQKYDGHHLPLAKNLTCLNVFLTFGHSVMFGFSLSYSLIVFFCAQGDSEFLYLFQSIKAKNLIFAYCIQLGYNMELGPTV